MTHTECVIRVFGDGSDAVNNTHTRSSYDTFHRKPPMQLPQQKTSPVTFSVPPSRQTLEKVILGTLPQDS